MVGALATFISVVILAPMTLLVHEMLSFSTVRVTVFFTIMSMAPLVLVLLQANSRTTTWANSSSDAIPDSTVTADQAAATA